MIFGCSRSQASDPILNTTAMTDAGYLALQNVPSNTTMPTKRRKKNPPSKEDTRYNRQIAKDRVPAEHVIGAVKRFKIVSDRYRNRRNRFGLRFTLIAAAYNKEVMS